MASREVITLHVTLCQEQVHLEPNSSRMASFSCSVFLEIAILSVHPLPSPKLNGRGHIVNLN